MQIELSFLFYAPQNYIEFIGLIFLFVFLHLRPSSIINCVFLDSRVYFDPTIESSHLINLMANTVNRFEVDSAYSNCTKY